MSIQPFIIIIGNDYLVLLLLDSIIATTLNFVSFKLFSPYNDTLRKVLLLSPIHRWGNWGLISWVNWGPAGGKWQSGFLYRTSLQGAVLYFSLYSEFCFCVLKFFLFFSFPHTLKGFVGSQFPDKGLNPHPWQWKCRILTTGLPGNSPKVL